MKWIKTFEELKPSTYRKAGEKLISIGKNTRGDKLIDYSYEKEWGFYNLWFSQNSDGTAYIYKFTNPSAEFKILQNDTILGSGEELSVEEMLDLWKDGTRELYFTINFKFKASQSMYKYSGNTMPLFAFAVHLAWPVYDLDDDPDNYTIHELYNSEKKLSIDLIKPEIGTSLKYQNRDKEYFFKGIFSDRKSALKFKKELPNLITDDIKDKIFSIFSLLGAETNDYTNCIEKLLNPSLNYLCSEGPGSPSQNDYHKKNIVQTNNLVTKDIPKKEIKEKPSTITTTGNIKPVYNLKREQ